MKADTVLAEYRSFCRAHADPASIAKYARYFKEGFAAYGALGGGELVPFQQELIARHTGLDDPAAALALGRECFDSGMYEDASLAVALAKHVLAKLGSAHLPELGRWFAEGVSNWAISDTLCSEVLSKLLIKGVLQPADFASWIAAGNRWQRRGAVVALIPLAKKQRGGKELLALIEPLMGDAERVVHQGLGWFLRECWKLEPAPVEALLLKYKDSAARLIFQYACEKMGAEQKQRYKRARKA